MSGNKIIIGLFVILSVLLVLSCDNNDEPEVIPDKSFQLISARVGTNNLKVNDTVKEMPVDKPVVVEFAAELDTSTVKNNFFLLNEDNEQLDLTYNYLDNFKTISVLPANDLSINTVYTIEIDNLKSKEGAVFPGATFTFKTEQGELILEQVTINEIDLIQTERITGVALKPEIKAVFSHPLNIEQDNNTFIRLTGPGFSVPLDLNLVNENKTIIITPVESLQDFTKFRFILSDDIRSEEGRIFNGFSKEFYTRMDSTPKFPVISQEELLTLIQQQTFKYFYDFAHSESGMARERNTSGNIVTSGGSGFGIMALIVGIERNFISRQEGIDRLDKILTFLENADRFHGVWPHWMNGNTGEVIPFSQLDDGADLVETSFLMQGLLTFRQYLNENEPGEKLLINRINHLWENVEWTWFTQEENVLYWHWSPDFGFEKNLKISGWNEALIVYVLAASSPTYPIEPVVYHEGWTRNGAIKNGNEYYNIELPLGPRLGGPLFFAHYSFLGLDPRNLKDQYADYWKQNKNHSLINWRYCIDNPLNYVGYTEDSWGLTASDDQNGYSAHSPTNDLGVITPTAALSSMPYIPENSLDAAETFYYLLGDRLWGKYGFYDAFNPTEGWHADSYLAIDQGPIVVMIENYRTALLWDLFMSAPEVQNGLKRLGFTFQ